MWPWGHLAFGYLLYAVYCAIMFRKAPREWPVVVLAVGTQFPDLVDKPLAYWFGVLPEGRTLTHSLVIFLPIGVAIVAIAWYYGQRESGTSFSIGWGSHIVGDSIGSLMQGSYSQLSFLLWPLRPAPDYEAPNFLFHARQLLASLRELNGDVVMSPGENLFIFQLWLAVGVFLLWLAQGMPPIRTVGHWVVKGVDWNRLSP